MWCSKIQKFPSTNKKTKDFFSFCDRVYVITVKKDNLTKNQQDSIENINKLGCTNKTFWCYTKGYKDKNCNHKLPNDNSCYNHFHMITEDAIKNNFENILIFEDDFTIESNIWKNYEEKKSNINKLISNNINNPMIIFFGYLPIYEEYINKFVTKGRYLLGHAYMMNKESIKKINKFNIPNDCFADNEYFKNINIRMFAIKPNNLFFQKSDISSTSTNVFINFYKLQKMFTKRMYYQYDPLIVPYHEFFYDYYTIKFKLFFVIFLFYLFLNSK